MQKSKRIVAIALCGLVAFSACAGQYDNLNKIKCEEPYKLSHKYVVIRKPKK